jgi:hypothetical protein
MRFIDGTEEEASLPVSRTMAAPLPGDRVIAKFRTLTEDILEPARGDAIIEQVLQLETLDDISGLIGLLAPPVGAAFA